MKQYYYQRKEVNYKMAQIDLTKYGITGTTEIVYNPSYEHVIRGGNETGAGRLRKRPGQTELGAVNVMTGIYTGRSPKDKFIVVDENSKDTVWWTSDEYKNDNHPASQETWTGSKRDRIKRALQQETVRCRCILRRKQRHPHGDPFYR